MLTDGQRLSLPVFMIPIAVANLSCTATEQTPALLFWLAGVGGAGQSVSVAARARDFVDPYLHRDTIKAKTRDFR